MKKRAFVTRRLIDPRIEASTSARTARRRLLQALAIPIALVAGKSRQALANGVNGDREDRSNEDGNIDLAAKIQDLEAREAIKELRAAYCWYATRADVEQYKKLYTKDCVFEMKRNGKREKFYGPDAVAELVAVIAPGTVTPVVGNETTLVDGAEARGTCVARNTIRDADGKSQIVVGFYDDKFRFEDGRWKFSQRRWFTYSPEYEKNDVQLF